MKFLLLMSDFVVDCLFLWRLWAIRKLFLHWVGQEKHTTHPTVWRGRPFPAPTRRSGGRETRTATQHPRKSLNVICPAQQDLQTANYFSLTPLQNIPHWLQQLTVWDFGWGIPNLPLQAIPQFSNLAILANYGGPELHIAPVAT